MATKGIDAMKKGTMKIALLGCVALSCGCKTVQMKATPFYEGNDVTYSLFGAKGYLDFDPVC